MSFLAKIKEKLLGKSTKQKEKYVVGLDKSRRTFEDKLNALAARYRNVDEDYFDDLEQILIESDVGIRVALDIVE